MTCLIKFKFSQGFFFNRTIGLLVFGIYIYIYISKKGRLGKLKETSFNNPSELLNKRKGLMQNKKVSLGIYYK
jgi:hypothetical protein